MKKIIINMLLSVCFIHLHAQTGLPYKSLSIFKNDTIAYLVYNFEKRADSYKGKTVDEVLKDLRIPVVFYRVYYIFRPHGIHSLSLYFNSDTDITSESSYYIYIVSNTNYSEYAPIIGEWSSKIYESLKSIKVECVYVSTPRNSEYYKEKERKRKKEMEKEKPQFVPESTGVFHRWDPDKHLEQ